jgi:hypothetical protein
MIDIKYDEHNARLIEQCKPIIELHLNSLATDYELLTALAGFASQALIPNINTFDRNTGLRYTPAMVIKYMNKHNGDGGKV